MSRPLARLSASQRAELDKQDIVLLARPIQNDPRILAAFTRKMVRLMRNRHSPAPSLDAAGFIANVFESSVAALTPPPAKAAIAWQACCARPKLPPLPSWPRPARCKDDACKAPGYGARCWPTIAARSMRNGLWPATHLFPSPCRTVFRLL
jgi:hypothetical protein